MNNNLFLGTDRHEDDIFREVVDLVRQEVGQVSSFKRAVILPALPKVLNIIHQESLQ